MHCVLNIIFCRVTAAGKGEAERPQVRTAGVIRGKMHKMEGGG